MADISTRETVDTARGPGGEPPPGPFALLLDRYRRRRVLLVGALEQRDVVRARHEAGRVADVAVADALVVGSQRLHRRHAVRAATTAAPDVDVVRLVGSAG